MLNTNKQKYALLKTLSYNRVAKKQNKFCKFETKKPKMYK